MRPALVLDVATACGLVLLGLVELTLTSGGAPQGRGAVEIVGLCAVGGCLVARRSRPTTAALLVMAVLTVVWVLAGDSHAWLIGAVIIAQYSGGRHSAPLWRQLLVLGSGVGYGF